MNDKKKLYKDISRKKVCGVLAGFSDYINGDVSLIRILFILISIEFFSIAIPVYFICALIMPDKTEIYNDIN